MQDTPPYLNGLADSIRVLSPAEQEHVLGANFTANVALQKCDETGGVHHPVKQEIFHKISAHHDQKPVIDNEWNKYAGVGKEKISGKPEKIDDENYWHGVVQTIAENIPDCPEKDALANLPIDQSSPQQAIDVCANIQSVLLEQLKNKKADVGRLTKEAGIRQGKITKEIKEANPNTSGMDKDAYNDQIKTLVNAREEVIADKEKLEAAKKAEITIFETEQSIRHLKKRAQNIQQQQAENQQLLTDAHDLAAIISTEPQNVVDDINTIVVNQITRRQQISQDYTDDQIMADAMRSMHADNDLEMYKKLYAYGALDRIGFLRHVVEHSHVSEHVSFNEQTKNAFNGKMAEVKKVHDDLILLAFAPAKEVAEFTSQDALTLFDNRIEIYKHVDTVAKNIAQNKYIEKQHSEQEIVLTHEMMRATVFPNYQINLRMGIGGSTVGEPLGRLPAYIVPAVHILKAVQSANKEQKNLGINTTMPTLTVFSAQRVSSKINNFDNTQAEETAKNSLLFLQNSVDLIYGPEIADRIEYISLSTYDLDHDKTIPLCQKAGSYLAMLYMNHEHNAVEATKLNTILQQADVSPREFASAVDAMGRRAYKHDAKKQDPSFGYDPLPFDEKQPYILKGIAYAAYHPTASLFGDIAYKNSGKPHAHKVIKIGGQGEQHFNTLQRVITVMVMHNNPNIIACNNPKTGASFITGTTGCNPAPYYAGKDDLHVSHIHGDRLELEERVALLERQDSKTVNSTLTDWMVLRQEVIDSGKVAAEAPLIETVEFIGMAAPRRNREQATILKFA